MPIVLHRKEALGESRKETWTSSLAIESNMEGAHTMDLYAKGRKSIVHEGEKCLWGEREGGERMKSRRVFRLWSGGKGKREAEKSKEKGVWSSRLGMIHHWDFPGRLQERTHLPKFLHIGEDKDKGGERGEEGGLRDQTGGDLWKEDWRIDIRRRWIASLN